ncbi:MAG: dethiobiotin synthase [Nitrospiria bacterium]
MKIKIDHPPRVPQSSRSGAGQLSSGVFITGTDTGVGKTVIAGAIARALSSEGIDVGVMKPIETGCRIRRGKFVPADGAYLKASARSDDDLELITPYTFRDPLAPYAASIRTKKRIGFAKILTAFDRLRMRHSFLIVEGIGGLIVPLTARTDLLNLILLLNLPVLLVARSGLGTLNHTLLTLRYGTDHGIRFLGVVLNRTSPVKPLSEATNLKILRERAGLPVIGPLPYLEKKGSGEKEIERSKTLFNRNVLMKEIISRWIDPRSTA